MLPLAFYDYSLHASSHWVAGGSDGANRSNLLIGWSRLDLAEPPCTPAGATCNLPFFYPLEAEFEKVVFTKVVALVMLYLVLFEN